jgi:hypothetical protein
MFIKTLILSDMSRLDTVANFTTEQSENYYEAGLFNCNCVIFAARFNWGSYHATQIKLQGFGGEFLFIPIDIKSFEIILRRTQDSEAGRVITLYPNSPQNQFKPK